MTPLTVFSPIINTTYFIGDLDLAVKSATWVVEALEMVIAIREPEYLRKMLGIRLYYEFITKLNAPPFDFKWQLLRDGADWFDNNGNYRQWLGLTNDLKQSPIACYVYYWYNRKNFSKTLAEGQVVSKLNNAETVSPARKMVDAWNKMVKLNIELIDFLNFNTALYGEFWSNSYDTELVTPINEHNL